MAGWVAGRLAELVDRWAPVAVGYDAAGPALDVADEATRAGLDLGRPVKGAADRARVRRPSPG